MGVRRLIRSSTTGQFLAEHGTWTTAHSDALDFPDLASAMACRDALGLTHVELVLLMGEEPDSAYDVVLPLRDADC